MVQVIKSGFRDSLKISLVVGTLLTLVNQHESIFAMQLEWPLLLKIFMNYLIPFSVASYSKIQYFKRTASGS